MKKLTQNIINTKIAGVSIAPMLVAGFIAFTSTAIMGSMLLEPSDRDSKLKKLLICNIHLFKQTNKIVNNTYLTTRFSLLL